MKKIPLILLLLLGFFLAFGNLTAGQEKITAARVEDTVRMTAVSCYAANGFYPPDVEYMEENFGLQVNREKYRIHYEIFADNLMPEITVAEVTG